MTKKLKASNAEGVGEALSVKSESHVKFFLAHARPKEEVDEMAIKHYCSDVLKTKLRFAKKDAKNSYTVTYAQFKQWLSEPSPDCGDVIVYDDLASTGKVIAKVRIVQLDCIRAGAVYYHDQGRLKSDDTMLPPQGYRPPTAEEELQMKIALSKSGLEWNYEYNLPAERFIPTSGNYVRFVTADGREGAGVVSDIERGGRTIMYFVKFCDKPIMYNMAVDVGETDLIKFLPLDALCKKILIKELEEAGKAWNPYIRRVEAIVTRVERGKTYYYINDKLNVSQIHESESYKDNRRYACGNYFPTKEQALKARIVVMETVKRIHATPQSELDN